MKLAIALFIAALLGAAAFAQIAIHADGHVSYDPIDIDTNYTVMVGPDEGSIVVALKQPRADVASMQAKLAQYEAEGSMANQKIQRLEKELADAREQLKRTKQ